MLVANGDISFRIISNWNREFDAWTPTVRKLVYIGDKNDRKRIQKRLTNQGFDVLITTLQLVVTTMSTTMPLTVDDLKSSLDFYKDQAKSAPIRMPKPYIITADMINSLSLTSYYQRLHSRKVDMISFLMNITHIANCWSMK